MKRGDKAVQRSGLSIRDGVKPREFDKRYRRTMRNVMCSFASKKWGGYYTHNAPYANFIKVAEYLFLKGA